MSPPPVPTPAEARRALDAARRIPIRRWPSIAVTLSAFALVGLSLVAAHHAPLPPAVWALPIAGGMLQLAVVVHACAHDALFGRPLDRVIGALAGALALTPFGAYRRGHRAHHRYVGTDRDPAPAPAQPVAPSALLTGLMRLRVLPVFYWAGVYGRYALYAALPTAEPRRPRVIARWITEAGAGLGLWAAIVAVDVDLGPPLALGWLGGGILYEHLFTFTQHLGLRPDRPGVHGPRSQTHFARSTALPGAAAVLHFNLHKEHHLAPGLHWQRLPALHRALATARPDIYRFTDPRLGLWRRHRGPAHRVMSPRLGDPGDR